MVLLARIKSGMPRAFGPAAIFLAGLVTGIAGMMLISSGGQEPSRRFERREGGFVYINPLLECEGASDIIGSQDLKSFKYKVEDLIKAAKERAGVDAVAVTFRDLNNGPSFGINSGREKFAPASLMKVPLMMAFYKSADSDPAVLRARLTYDAVTDANNVENIKATTALQKGASYTTDELISFMISYSDNNAFTLLNARLSPSFLAKTYDDLGLLPPEGQVVDYMTAKSYASCFRILFNSSYLSRQMSEKALALLAKTEYRNGLVAGVPEGTAVAHKFGERAFLGSNVKELHDCGIVYYPGSPYLLCIMTKGTDFARLEATIREISHLVYTEIKSQEQGR